MPTFRLPRPIMIESAAALLLARLALLLVPARRLLRGARSGAWAGQAGLPQDQDIADVARALERAARRVPFTCTCLVRAMAGRAMLRRRGIPCTLHLGVARQNGALAAHAWLEAGGGVVTGGDEAPNFVPLVRLGDGGCL
ncbi:hypothetical protein CHU95_02190 [Niveispirillum lacus]|uniref:Microcin J25-processing protein McjB C-terminal domain-containing protein n=1 Tax=Niveispirillum lacus TaxID=1981099 RepID=A0A255Z6W6_9PROT|nr:lasso peptide biosynthesis B2 protein [Niveispirillum lacus]OYQ37179.1 hypothetical protein CHU95_02190 [Niveispirillum lacus]